MPNQEELLRQVQERLDRKYSTLDPAIYGKSDVSLGGYRDSQGYDRFTPTEVNRADRYDVSLTPGMDVNEALAASQGGGDLIIKGAQRLIGSTVLKTIAAAGYLGGLVTNIGEDNYISAVADNALSQFANSLEEDMKEKLPVFKNKEYQDGNVFQKMMSPEFWADDVVDGVAFMASNWLPGLGVGKLALGQKLMANLSKASGAYKGLAGAAEAEQFLTPAIQKWAQGLDKTTQFGLLSSVEAFAEADGVRREMIDRAEQAYQNGEIGFGEYLNRLEDSKEAAAQSYALNMTVLAPSNLFEVSLINKIAGKQAPKIEGLTTKGLGVTEVTKGSIGKARALGAGAAILSEGAYEENIQFGIEEAAKSYSAENRGQSFLETYADNLQKTVGSTLDVGNYSKERWLAIALGSVIGVGPGAIAGGRDQAKKNDAADKVAKAITDSYKAFSGLDVYERGEDGKLVLENGKPKIDPQKEAAVQSKLAQMEALGHVLEDMEDKSSVVMDYTKGKAFASMAQAYHQAGKYDEFMKLIENNEDIDPKFVRHAKKLEALFDTNEEGLTRDATTEARSIKLKEIGADILFLNDINDGIEKKLAEKKKEIEDTFESTPAVKRYVELLQTKKELEAKIQSFEAGKKTGARRMPNKPKVGDMYVMGDIGDGNPLSFSQILSTPSAASMVEMMNRGLEEVNTQIAEAEKELDETKGEKTQAELLKRMGEKELDLLALQKAEMEAVRFVRGKQFENLATPTGAKAYTEMLNKMGQAMDPSKFDFAAATKDTYKDFEEAVLGVMRYGLNKKQVERKYAGDDVLNEARKGNIQKVIDAFSDPNFKVDPEQAKELEGILEEYIPTTMATIETEIGEITQETDRTILAQKALEKVRESLVEDPEITDELIKLETAKNRTQLANEVIQNFERSPDYSNVDEGERQLLVLKKLLSLIDDRTGTAWAELISDLKNKIEYLEKTVIPKLKQRAQDREKQIERIVEQHGKESFSALGVDSQGNLDETAKVIDQILGGKLTEAVALAKKDNMNPIYALAIFSKICQLSEESKKRVIDILKAQQELLLTAVKPFLAKGHLATMTALPESYPMNPLQYIRQVIISLGDTFDGVDAERDSAIKKWLSSYDFARFKEEVKSRPDGQYLTKDLEELLTIHEQYAGLAHALTFIESDDILPYEILNEIQALIDNPKLTAASDEQMFIIREVTSFLKGEGGNKLFEPFAYLSGFAGTGKTNLVVRWVKGILRLLEDDIYACSLTEKASEELNNSLAKAGSKDSWQGLLKALEAPISFTSKLIIIDEVTRLSEGELTELANKVKQLNEWREKHKQSPVKVLCLGDPNQLQASVDRVAPTLDDAVSRQKVPGITNITVIRSLSTRFRSNVQAVTDFQDLFVSEGRDMSKDTLIAKASSTNPLVDSNALGVFGLTNPFEQVKTWLANQNLKDGKRRTIITTEKKKAEYLKLVEGTNVEVLTAEEAQGLTREQVVVDLPAEDTFASRMDYNKKMYTALSRATEFLMVANLTITNAADTALPALAKQRLADNTKRAEEFLNKRLAEFEKIVGLFEGVNKNTAKDLINKKVKSDTQTQKTQQEIDKALGVTNQTETKTTVPTPPTSDIEAKKADIERRRQEELKNAKIEIPRYFTFNELGGAKGKSGKALSSVESDENEKIQKDFESKLEEGDKLIEPNGDIYFFKNNKVVKANGQPRGMNDIGAFINGVTIDRTDKINAKSDAEYVDAVKKGEMTKEQAMQALEEVGRKDSSAYAELADLERTKTPASNPTAGTPAGQQPAQEPPAQPEEEQEGEEEEQEEMEEEEASDEEAQEAGELFPSDSPEEDYMPTEEETIIMDNGEEFTPAFINSNNVKRTFVNDKGETEIIEGYGAEDDVIFIKTGEDKLVALAKSPGKGYIEVAILSTEEIVNLGLQEKYKAAVPYLAFHNRIGYSEHNIPDQYILARAKITRATPTKYRFGPQQELNGQTLRDTITKVVSATVRGTPPAQALDYAMKHHAAVIFTKKTKEEWSSTEDNRKDLAKILMPGRVYLMIPVRTKVGAKIFYQAVQLPRKEFQQTEANRKKLMGALIEFTSTVEKISQKLSTKFPNLTVQMSFGSAWANEFIRRVGKGDLTGGASAFLSEEYGMAKDPMLKKMLEQAGVTEESLLTSDIVDLCRKAYLLFERPSKEGATLVPEVGSMVKNHKNKFTFTVNTKEGTRQSSKIAGKITKIENGIATVEYAVKGQEKPTIVESPLTELYVYYTEAELSNGEAQKQLNRLAFSNTMFNDVVIRASDEVKRKGSGSRKIVTGKKLLFYGSGQFRKTQNVDQYVASEAAETANKYAAVDGNTERASKYVAKVQETLTSTLTVDMLKRITNKVSGEFKNWQLIPLKYVSEQGESYKMTADTLENTSENILHQDSTGEIIGSLVNINLEAVVPTRVSLRMVDESSDAPATPTAPKRRRPTVRLDGSPLIKGADEASKFNLIDLKRALKYLKKLFPSFNEDDLQIVNQSVLMRLTQGKQAWGYFKKGVIFLEDNAEGIYEEVLKHEAMHRIWEYHLSNTERERLRDMLGPDVKEELSNVYMGWKKGKRTELWLARIFKKIRQLLGFYNRNFESLEEFFEKVEAGEFVQLSREQAEDIQGAPLLKIVADFGNPRNFIEMKYALATAIDQLTVYDPIDNNNFYTREQARDIIKEQWLSDSYVPVNRKEEATAEDLVVSDTLYNAIMFYREVVANKESKKDLFDKVFDHFYNKSTYSGIAEDEANDDLTSGDTKASEGVAVDATGEATEDENAETKANLREHIEEGDTIDRMKKLFRSAKDFIGTVFITEAAGTNKNRRVLMSAKSAFAILAQRLSNFSTESDEQMQKDLREIFSLNSNPRVKAVADKFLYVLEESMRSGVMVDGVAYDLNDSRQVGEMEYTSIKEEQPDKFVFRKTSYIRSRNIDNAEWFDKISEETGIPFEVLAALYKKAKGNDMINSLITGAGSLRKKTPHKGEEGDPTFINIEGTSIPVKERRYIQLEVEYQKLTLKGQVENALTSAVADGTIKSLAEEIERKRNAVNGKPTLAREALEEILGKMGLLKKAGVPIYIPGREQKVFADLHAILQSAAILAKFKNVSEVPRKEQDIFTIVEATADGQTRRLVTLGELLKSEHKTRTDNVQEAIASQLISHEQNTSYRGAGDKTRWLFTVSSQAHDILESLRNISSSIKGFPVRFAKTAVYSMNPFLAEQENVLIDGKLVKKKLKVGRLIDHDSVESGSYVTQYKEEGFLQVLERVLFLGFNPNSSVLSGTGFGARTYFQFNMINSNKPETRATEVQLLNKAEIRGWLRHILIQESKRPQLNLKNYTPKVSNIAILDSEGKLVYPEVVQDVTDEKQLNARIAEIERTQEKQVQDITNILLENKFVLPGDFNRTLQELHEKGFITLTEEQLVYLNSTDFTKNNTNKFYANPPWLLEEYLRMAVGNNLVNGYFLNQATIGDESFFGGAYDIIKRMSIAWGTGYRGRVSDKNGVPKKFKTLIIKDQMESFKNVMEELLKDPKFKRLVGEDFNRTDAQGFITEAFAKKLRKGFSRGMQLGNILKPVHYEVDDLGVPRAVKYSALVLSEPLMREFPQLRVLNDYLEDRQASQAVFESAVKVGLPKNILGWNEIQEGKEAPADSIIELSGEHFRIQLNPRHELNGHVTQPSQLLYFLLSNANNWERAMSVYKDIAEMQVVKSRAVSEHLALRGRKRGSQMKVVKAGRERVKKFIVQTLRRSAHTATNADLLSDPEISLNFPTVQQMAKRMFNAGISKRAVELSYPGTKMVLVSDIGTDKPGVEKPKIIKIGEDKYAHECYVPRGFAEKHGLKEGSIFLGFRIPSTELHSGAPLIVKGFIDDPLEDNVIITTSEFTFLHGSDFDIDALFVIHQQAGHADLKSFDGTRTLYQAKTPSGAPIKYFKVHREAMKQEMDMLSDKLNTSTDKEEKKKIREYLFGTMTSNKDSLSYHYSKAIENTVIENLLTIILDPANRETMFTPITMEGLKIKDEKDANPNQPSLFEKIRDWRGLASVKDLFETRFLHSFLDYAKMHQDNFSGAKGTGVFANATKGYNYLFGATGDPNVAPALNENIAFGFAGISYDKLSKFELTPEGKVRELTLKSGAKVPAKVGERFDALINAAIDNVKEQILAIVNVTGQTMNAWVGLTAVGMPLEHIGAIMQNPAVFRLNQTKGSSARAITKIKKEILESLKEITQSDSIEKAFSLIDSNALTLEEVEGAVMKDSSNPFPLAGLSKEQLILQYKILDILERGTKIADFIGDHSKMANLAKAIPTATWEQAELRSLMTKYYKVESSKENSITYEDKEGTKVRLRLFPVLKKEVVGDRTAYVPKESENMVITNVNMLEHLPHIRTAYNIVETQLARCSDMFTTSNSFLQGLMKNILSRYLPGLNFDKGRYHTLETMIEEFTSFNISTAKIEHNGEVVIDMDCFNEEPVIIHTESQTVSLKTLEQLDEMGDTSEYTVLTGQQAWAVRFVQQMRGTLGKTSNEFLKALTVSSGAIENQQLRMFIAGQLEPEDIAIFQQAFMELSETPGTFTKLQWDLVKYLLITSGAKYGSSNYATILPAKVLAPVDKTINSQMQDVLDEAQEAYALALKEASLDELKERQKTEKVKEEKKSIKEQISKAFEAAGMAASEVLYKKFFQFRDSFTLQLAINHADKMSNVSSERIVKTENGRRGVDILKNGDAEIPVYYDLKLTPLKEEEKEALVQKMSENKSDEDSEEAALEYANALQGAPIVAYYGTLFVRVQLPDGVGAEHIYYQEAGKAGRLKKYQKPTQQKSFRDMFKASVPVRVVKSPHRMTSFVDKSKAPLMPVGAVIGFRSYRDVGRNFVSLYRIVEASEAGGNKRYKLQIINDGGSTESVIAAARKISQDQEAQVLGKMCNINLK